MLNNREGRRVAVIVNDMSGSGFPVGALARSARSVSKFGKAGGVMLDDVKWALGELVRAAFRRQPAPCGCDVCEYPEAATPHREPARDRGTTRIVCEAIVDDGRPEGDIRSRRPRNEAMQIQR